MSIGLAENAGLGPCEVQDQVWAKMSTLPAGVKKRKKSETKPQAQINKCNNEKRRREQENIYIEELAELISANFADMSSLSVKPDKCAILQETVNQIRSIKQREGASRSTDPVQQGDVSSSRPTILSTDVYGPLLLEALDGFLFVVNAEGKVEHVTKNVKNFIKFTEEDVLGETIYNFIHPGDHARFSTSLPMTIGWGSEPANKSRSFSCRLLVKSDKEQDDPVKEKQQREHRYEVMYISSTQLTQGTQVSDEDSGDSGPCLMCVASRFTHRDRAAIFGLEQFTTKLDTTGNIIGIDISGVPGYSHILNKDLMGRPLQELCAPQDLHKLAQHLRDVLGAGQATSVVYRIKLGQEKYLNLQTKSKLFRATPNSQETDFIMATHSVVGDNDQTRTTDPGGGNNNNNNNSVGGPLMTSIVNGTSSRMSSNNDSPSLSNSMSNSANPSTYTPFHLDNDFTFDLQTPWDMQWAPDPRSDMRQSLTPASTPTSRPPSAPAYSPGGAAQSPMFVTQQSPAPNPPTPATYSTYNFSPAGDVSFHLDDQKDTKVNMFEDGPSVGAPSSIMGDKLRGLLLTKRPNSVESSDMDNKNQDTILKNLLNQRDEDDEDNMGSPKMNAAMVRVNSIPGPSEPKPKSSTGPNSMLKELLNEKSTSDDDDRAACLKPQSELLQILLKEEEPPKQEGGEDLLRSLGFPSPAPANGEGKHGIKRTHEQRDSSTGTRELWKKNKMLAQLLATQPNPQAIPPIPTAVLMATPQDKINDQMKNLTHDMQQQDAQQQQQHQNLQQLMAAVQQQRNSNSRGHQNRSQNPRTTTTTYLNQILTTGDNGIQRAQQIRHYTVSTTAPPISSANEIWVPQQQPQQHLQLQQSASDSLLSDILDEVIDFAPDTQSNDIISIITMEGVQNFTNNYQQSAISEKMAINKIQESLMQIGEAGVNSPTSPNMALTVAPPAYATVMTTQTAQQQSFQQPPGYQRPPMHRQGRSQQFAVTGGNNLMLQQLQLQKLQQQQYERDKVRLLNQQQQQRVVHQSNAGPPAPVDIKSSLQNMDSILNNTVAPNVTLQRSSSVPEAQQLSPPYAGPMSQSGQRGGFVQTTVGSYQHNPSRVSPHPPFNQQLSPRQVYTQGPAQTPNAAWPQNQQQRLSTQQKQNPMLNAQLTGNFVAGPTRGFQVQQQQQRAIGSPGTVPTRHSPFGNDTFPPPGSPNATFSQNNQYLRLQRTNSAPTANANIPGGLGSPRPYGRDHAPHSYPQIPQNPHLPLMYQQESQYCYDQLPFNGADRGRLAQHLQPGVSTGSATTSEYVRQELRNVVGARAQGQPSGSRAQSQLLNQNVNPDLDLGLGYDLPTTGASESPKLWGAMGSEMGSMSPQPAASRSTMEEGRQGDHSSSSSLLQKLLSE